MTVTEEEIEVSTDMTVTEETEVSIAMTVTEDTEVSNAMTGRGDRGELCHDSPRRQRCAMP